MTEVTIPDDLNLYDAEIQNILAILARLQMKYAERRATFENLNSLNSEAADTFEKAGFIVTVSVFDDDMRPVLPPSITIHGRVDPKEFDPDRQQWEVKKDVAQEVEVKDFLKKGGTEDQSTKIKSTVDLPEQQK